MQSDVGSPKKAKRPELERSVYHSSKALLLLKRYIVGRVVEPRVNVESPIRFSKTNGRSPGSQNGAKMTSDVKQAIARDYRALHEQIKAAGLYHCRYSDYTVESVRCALLVAAFVYLLRCEWYVTSALFLSMFWHQIMFVAHDAGHRSITGDSAVDTLIGASIAGLCCGMSISWWKSSHNIHHLVTNMPEHDPDVQNFPFFSTSPAFARSLTSTRLAWTRAAELLVPYQQYTYYPMMALARFNLYALNWLHVCSPRAARLGAPSWVRTVELVFMACFWLLFAYLLVWRTLPSWSVRAAFVAVSHMATMLLHAQFTLSRWGMSTSDLGPLESFAQHQLRTTMDIECPPWLDWFYGGLQFQAVHHLFPRLPRHSLRRAQGLVRQFCERTGL
ncbi:hypothetical protein E8E12_002535, partial [Didymella heteroderae]